MSYMALYRKFRPDNFADVKGQDHIVTTLRNQLETNRIGHAYLFTGTRGTGKTTMAKIFARAVNCEHPTANGPCGECETCRAIESGASLNVVEIDAASNNSVDDVRRIVEEVEYRPTQGKYRVYIIDEVHMLTPQAFNALLKTLEEPPEYVMFILATTELHKILPTVLSRCQRYDFRRIKPETMVARMKELMEKEQVLVEDRALEYIARKADGAMRDALSMLDQCISFHIGEELTYDKVLNVLGAVDIEVFSDLLRYALRGDVLGCVDIVDEAIAGGSELTQFVIDFTWYLRNVMLEQASPDLERSIDLSSDNMERLREDAKLAEKEEIFRYIRIFSDLANQIRYASQKRVLVEIMLVKLCRPEMESDDDSLVARIAALEERLDSGDFVVRGAAGGDGSIGNAGNAGSRHAKVEKPQLPKALTEDVKRIIESWKNLCGDADHQLQAVFASCKPTLGEDGVLELVFDQGDMKAYMAGSNRDKIAEMLAARAGKEVEFRVRETATHEEFEGGVTDLRSHLKEVIKMEITEE